MRNASRYPIDSTVSTWQPQKLWSAPTATAPARRRAKAPCAVCLLEGLLRSPRRTSYCNATLSAEPLRSRRPASASAPQAPWPAHAWPSAPQRRRERTAVLASVVAPAVAPPQLRRPPASRPGSRQAPASPPAPQLPAELHDSLSTPQPEMPPAPPRRETQQLVAAPVRPGGRPPAHAGNPAGASAPPPRPGAPPTPPVLQSRPAASQGPVPPNRPAAPPTARSSTSPAAAQPAWSGARSGGSGAGGGWPAAPPSPPVLPSSFAASSLSSQRPAQPLQEPRPRRGLPPPRYPIPVFPDDDPRVAAAYDGLAVRVAGREPPAPLLSFNTLVARPAVPARWNVALHVMRNVAAAYRLGRPTPVQSHVIPAVMEGRDVLAVSCTGSGKTLAYLLPLVAQLFTRPHRGSKNFAWPEALILTPTRELAEQVYAEAELLLRGSHLKALLATGGTSVAEQALHVRGCKHRSAGGADLVVATPGRLLQLVHDRRLVKLGRLGCVVVDEADRLVELGMWPDLRRLLSHPSLPTARQTVLVASSLPTPELRSQAEGLLRDAVAVEVGDGSGASRAVRQRVERVNEPDKLPRLMQLLEPRGAAVAGVAGAAAGAAGSNGGGDEGPPEGPAVVFVGNVTRAEQVAKQLAARGLSVALLHRDLSHAQRDEAMQCFRFGVASVLVATGLAARGLNFPDVAHVVNYDVPITRTDYIHQVGRTGRGGRPGLATTLYTPSRFNRAAAPWLRDALRAAGEAVPPWLGALAGEAEAWEWTERTRRKDAFPGMDGTSQPGQQRQRGQAGQEVTAQKADAAAAVEAAEEQAAAAGVGSPAAASPVRPDGPGRRPQAVSLDDPEAASRLAFGAFMPPEQEQARGFGAGAGGGFGGGREARLVGSTGPGSRDRAVLRDRRHDPAHWQAVFDAALGMPTQQQPGPPPQQQQQHQQPPVHQQQPPLQRQPPQQLQGQQQGHPQQREQQQQPRQFSQQRGPQSHPLPPRAQQPLRQRQQPPPPPQRQRGPGAGPAPGLGSHPGFAGPARRLQYRDGAAALEAGPAGGLSAGAGPAARRRSVG